MIAPRIPLSALGALLTGLLNVTAIALAESPGRSSASARREKVVKDATVLDANGIVLENDCLRAAIAVDPYAGQVMSLIYKPTGHELAAASDPQGYCTDRMGEDRYFWRRASDGYAGEILSSGGPEASARATYVWHYDHNDARSDIRVSKLFSLRAGESVLRVAWKLQNVGDQIVTLSPWIKHLGGVAEGILEGPTRMARPQGVTAVRTGEFYEPVRNWLARQSGTDSAAGRPMVTSVVDFRHLLQQFPWARRERFTLESILHKVSLQPGEAWQTQYALVVTPNVGNVAWAAPELVAGLVGPPPVAGRPASLTVEVAAARSFNSAKIAARIVGNDDRPLGQLSVKQANLTPGRIARLSYTVVPPEDGLYRLELSVTEAGRAVQLGRDIHSEESGIVIPFAVGPAPDIMVKPWPSHRPTWRKRKARRVQPIRVVARTETLSAGQVDVLHRVYPEDVHVFAGEVEPALQITCAQNEWESAQLVVQRSKNAAPAELSLEATPIHGAADSTALPVEAYEVRYVRTTIPSSYRAEYPVGQWPDPLWRITPRAIDPGKHRAFWLTVRAPAGAPPGHYQGSVRVLLDGRVAATFSLRLQVRPFVLPAKPKLQALTNQVGFTPARIASNLTPLGYEFDTWKDVLEEYWKLCTDYGWSPMVYTGPEMWQRYADRGRGMTGFQAAPADEAWLRERGLLERAFGYVPFMEHTDSMVPKAVEWCRQWKGRTRIPVVDSYYGANVEPLFGLVDIWAGQSPQQEWAKRRRRAFGDRFWSVNNPLVWYIEIEPTQGRSAFWSYFTRGYDGHRLYSNIRWSDNVYESNWSGGGNYLGCTIYPAAWGLAKGIRWEMLRDALEDFDYLWLLREAANRYDTAGRNDAPAAVAAARSIVSDLELAEEVDTPRRLQEMRTRVAELIEALQPVRRPANRRDGPG